MDYPSGSDPATLSPAQAGLKRARDFDFPRLKAGETVLATAFAGADHLLSQMAGRAQPKNRSPLL